MNDFWATALLGGCIGFVIAYIIIKRSTSEFEENLADCVYSGKQVIIAVDGKAHIFTLENGRMVIKQGQFHLDNKQ